jgi:hypothetical protein
MGREQQQQQQHQNQRSQWSPEESKLFHRLFAESLNQVYMFSAPVVVSNVLLGLSHHGVNKRPIQVRDKLRNVRQLYCDYRQTTEVPRLTPNRSLYLELLCMIFESPNLRHVVDKITSSPSAIFARKNNARRQYPRWDRRGAKRNVYQQDDSPSAPQNVQQPHYDIDKRGPNKQVYYNLDSTTLSHCDPWTDVTNNPRRQTLDDTRRHDPQLQHQQHPYGQHTHDGTQNYNCHETACQQQRPFSCTTFNDDSGNDLIYSLPPETPIDFMAKYNESVDAFIERLQV